MSFAIGNLSMKTLLGGIIPVVFEKNEIDCRCKWKVLNSFLFSDYRDFDGMISKICFSIESSSEIVGLSTGILIGEIKLIVGEK